MADDIVLNAGSGGDTIAADDISGVKHQRVKIQIGADGSATDVSSANPLPVSDNGSTLSVDDGGGSLTVDGTVAVSGSVTVADGGSTISVDDGSGSLTVDNAALSVVGGGAEATALRVTIATDSTGVLSVDDNGGSITVDGTVAVSGTVPVTDNGGSLTVDGTVTVQDGGSSISVDDNGGSLTVDGTVAATQSGTWSVRAQDGAGNALTSKAAGSERAISVAIVDGSGNQVTSFGGSGGTSASDDAAFTAGSGSGTPMMGFATADSVDSGDVGVVAMTTARALHVAVQSLPALAAGSNAIGTLAANSGVDIGDVTINNASGASAVNIQDGGNSITVDGTVTVQDGGSTISVDDNGSSLTVDGTVAIGTTTSGLSYFRSLDLDETEEEVKSSAGTVYGWYMSNSASSIRYVKFYNATAANVTVGSTTPVLTFLLPANSTSGVGANALNSIGIAFSTAITVAATTGVADADTGAPGANEVIVNLFYA